MKIEKEEVEENRQNVSVSKKQLQQPMVVVRRKLNAKRALAGAGARILFYPTLLYNVFRNKLEAEFRWWDEVDQYLLLGAVPFRKDVPRLKQLGVGGVVTLTEPYETLVPSSVYQAHGIDNLVIPTQDYLFAPSFTDITRAVEFIHKNASCGRTTYVHCKAGRGRGTTIVLCYLVEYNNMTPAAAFEYVRSIRPRVLLHPSQWKAVQGYSRHRSSSSSLCPSHASTASPPSIDAVLIKEADLEGYSSACDDNTSKKLAIAPRASKAKPMLARLSCLFPSFNVSGIREPVTGLVPEARTC